MGIFGKRPSPVMTEVYPTSLLQKFHTERTQADTFAMILHISEGIYALNSNNRKPRFNSIDDFDISASEILGSLDEVTFPRLIEILLFEPEYLNRFIEVSANLVKSAFSDLRGLLGHEPPISTETVNRFSPISNKLDFLVQEFSQVMLNLKEYITTESMVVISELVSDSRDLKAAYIEELRLSMEYIENFRRK